MHSEETSERSSEQTREQHPAPGGDLASDQTSEQTLAAASPPPSVPPPPEHAAPETVPATLYPASQQGSPPPQPYIPSFGALATSPPPTSPPVNAPTNPSQTATSPAGTTLAEAGGVGELGGLGVLGGLAVESEDDLLFDPAHPPSEQTSERTPFDSSVEVAVEPVGDEAKSPPRAGRGGAEGAEEAGEAVMVCVFEEGPIGINFACSSGGGGGGGGGAEGTEAGEGGGEGIVRKDGLVSRVVVLEASGTARAKGVRRGDAVVSVNGELGGRVRDGALLTATLQINQGGLWRHTPLTTTCLR